MKAKRGGNVDVRTIERLFADDPAMRALLSDCNREEVLSFFVNTPGSNVVGGAKRGRDERREEIEEDEELLAAAMEEMPISKKQKRDELEFPDKCSAVQRSIAVFASATIELMYKGATSAAACYYFPEQTQSLTNIMSGFLSVIGQNVGGQGTIAAIGAIGGFLYAYQKNGNINELIQKIFALAKQPFPGNALYSIMKRAVKICENDLVPIGRGVTIDSIKQRFWNKLGEYGLGPVAERRRQERQALLQLERKRSIPIPPPLGMPSRKPASQPTLEQLLQQNPYVQRALLGDLSDREKLDNARNLLEYVRKEIVNKRNAKAKIDKDIEKLEDSEDVIENPALMEFLDQSKAGSEMNAKLISDLEKKELEVLSEIRKLENMPRKLERTGAIYEPSAPAASLFEQAPSDMYIEEEEVVVEKPKKSKKRRDAEGGGKRKTHRKNHKKSKKHSSAKHNKKSAKRHHKKSHKKH